MLPETEVLLYAAARAQHVGEVLRPALESGAVVICDRYVDSTFAYQGGGRQLDMSTLESIQQYATGGLAPDLRVLLDLPVEVGLQRRLADAVEVNRLDVAELGFHQRVREAFLGLAAEDPGGWVVIDASATPDQVTTAVLSAVMPRLLRR
jgi:dTMP kinase